MLADFADWSDRAIAKHVGVHHSTVSDHRASLAETDSEPPTERTYTTKRYGKTVAAQREAICGNSADAPTTRTVERNGNVTSLGPDVAGPSRPHPELKYKGGDARPYPAFRLLNCQ